MYTYIYIYIHIHSIHIIASPDARGGCLLCTDYATK